MVEVFKTNVTEAVLFYVEDSLCSRFPLCRITFDLEDCDRILRVAGDNVCAAKIAEWMNQFGYECSALE